MSSSFTASHVCAAAVVGASAAAAALWAVNKRQRDRAAASLTSATTPRAFALERYFGMHEFTCQVLLSSSDVESLSMKELLKMCANDEKASGTIALWDDLSLGYTESQGHPELLDEIAATYSADVQASHILEVAPEEGILIAMSTLVAPGDDVIVTWPAYQSLYEVAQARGARLHKWSCRKGQRFDIGDLEEQIRACGGTVKLIVINFPHNPTGCWLKPTEIVRVVALARESRAFLFSDEMYRGLEHGDVAPLPSACELYEKAVCLSGFSKAYAMPGLRIGWLACRDDNFCAAARQFKDYTTICGSAPSQILALMGLRLRRAILSRSKAILTDGLAALDAFCAKHHDKFEYHAPIAGPVAYLRIKGDGLTAADAQQYSETLVKATGVMVVAGEMFEDNAGPYLRMGFAKAGFDERLAAWERTFDTVPLPGH